MPRQPRLDLAHIPQHVVQRGNDRQPCFFTDIDRTRYLQELSEIAMRENCAVHAYVLTTSGSECTFRCGTGKSQRRHAFRKATLPG